MWLWRTKSNYYWKYIIVLMLLGNWAAVFFYTSRDTSSVMTVKKEVFVKCDYQETPQLEFSDFYWRSKSFAFDSPYRTIAGFHPPGGSPAIPIFIMTKDRITVLKETIQSYHETIQTPFEIVIIDDYSTYPQLIDFLKYLEDSGVTVYRRPKPDASDSTDKDEHERIISERLNQVADIIQSHLKKSKSKYYVVTDPDVALSNCLQGRILELFMALHESQNVPVVGIGLRTDDVQPAVREIGFHRWFWPKSLESIEFDGYPAYFHPAPVDTTFGMYKRDFRFKRLNDGVRVVYPCIARHLDYYLDNKNLPEDSRYYMEKKENRVISHSSMYLEKNKAKNKL